VKLGYLDLSLAIGPAAHHNNGCRDYRFDLDGFDFHQPTDCIAPKAGEGKVLIQGLCMSVRGHVQIASLYQKAF